MKEGKEKEELLMRAIEKYETTLSIKYDKHDAANNWRIALAELAKMKKSKNIK